MHGWMNPESAICQPQIRPHVRPGIWSLLGTHDMAILSQAGASSAQSSCRVHSIHCMHLQSVYTMRRLQKWISMYLDLKDTGMNLPFWFILINLTIELYHFLRNIQKHQLWCELRLQGDPLRLHGFHGFHGLGPSPRIGFRIAWGYSLRERPAVCAPCTAVQRRTLMQSTNISCVGTIWMCAYCLYCVYCVYYKTKHRAIMSYHMIRHRSWHVYRIPMI